MDTNPLNKAMISFNYDFQTWTLRYTLVDKKTTEKIMKKVLQVNDNHFLSYYILCALYDINTVK